MSKKVDFVAQLQRLYTWSAVGYIGLAILAGVFMANVTYQTTIGHLTKDILASHKSAVLVPGAHAFIDIPLKWALVAMLGLSAVLPVLYLTRLKKYHQKALKKRVLLSRWVDLGLSTVFMMSTIALLSGVNDMMTIKMIGGLVALTCAMGWLAERAMTEGKKLVMPIFTFSLITGCLPWIVVAAYAVATPFFASVRASWFVYALYASTLFGCGLIAYNQWRYHQGKRAFKDYMFVERNYVVASILVRTAFAAILVLGLRK